MPSFLSCKSIGGAAIEEIVENRPYETINDLLWNEDGTWKHSKFNKRTLQALIRIKAFDSMGIVGEGCVFESYKHMEEVVVNKNSGIKKRTKREPDKGQKLFKQYLLESMGIGEWSRIEAAEMLVEYLGSCNASNLVPESVLNRFGEMGLSPIDEYRGKDIYWFIVTDIIPKKTKRGKPYLMLTVSGDSGVTQKMFMWNWDKQFNITKYSVCVAEVEKNDFGCSTRQQRVKILS
jgi:DNA polymerase III alpha subunit